MDTQNPSAPSRPQSQLAANTTRTGGGLVHEHTRHTTRFTVIGNHLAQHPSLSGLAIGLAVYIQSLPAGARVDIKTLAARFPEGTTRIAAALRELETHGYLRRERQRTSAGRIVTRTISCNQPGSSRAEAHPAAPPRKKRTP
ncbi:helix-turn-helix domain-containing protein, partial [Streptomyces muensis]|nr:helix-turn-helix domain-containing protein [Streptomyces muensis]